MTKRCKCETLCEPCQIKMERDLQTPGPRLEPVRYTPPAKPSREELETISRYLSGWVEEVAEA